MQKYIITCFFLAFMTVNQIKGITRKKRDREPNNQTDKFAIISLLDSFKGHSNEDASTYIGLKDDGDIEIQDSKITIVVPTKQIKGQKRKCRSKECRRRKDKPITKQSTNRTELQASVRNAILHLSSRSNPIVIMKARDLKKDWCRTERMKHKIKEKGCVPKTVINHYCYGQCNSFFIPRQILGKKGLGNFQSCAYCQPTSHRWVTITMRCPRLIPPIRKKRILRVDKCSCSTGTPTVF